MTGLAAFLSAHPGAVLVEITETRGSTPRETGSFMLVDRAALFGTIGGGQLEFAAIDHARRMLTSETSDPQLRFTLGPDSGQCCGGQVRLRFAALTEAEAQALIARDEADRRNWPQVMLFGAGHVGLALTRALAPLPLRTVLIDSRETVDGDVADGVSLRRRALPEAEISALRKGDAVVILTHDHALDFLIARAALARDDLAYIGMIGSKTKRASFASWLKAEGETALALDRLVIPIGGTSVPDKRPAVIAALVAAELVTALMGQT